jgi:hypothetical protein
VTWLTSSELPAAAAAEIVINAPICVAEKPASTR